MSSTQQAQRAEAEGKLKSEWGGAFDQKLGQANKAMREYAGDEFAAFLESSGLGDHPTLVKAFAKIAEKTMSEKDLVNSDSIATPVDLDKQIADHTAKYRDILMDTTHPEHRQRVSERTGLFNKRFG